MMKIVADIGTGVTREELVLDQARRNEKPPLVQQGQLPTLFITGLAALDITGEYVMMTFCLDHAWGSKDVTERELTHNMVMPRSVFDLIRMQIATRLGAAPPGH